MSNRLKVDLSKARFEKFRSVFDNLGNALKEADIDFYVLGALARDMLFSKEQINTRTTADVDLAVYINMKDGDKYRSLRKDLIENYAFIASKENNFALISHDGVTIDLLPFGEIEMEDGVEFKGEGLSNIKVNGFKEVHLKGLEEVETQNNEFFKVAKLSSIILLKLIAYDDRPENRTNDPGDIASIIGNYFELRSEYIYENHSDLFDNDMDLTVLAAHVIGREMKPILQENDALNERIVSILKMHITQGEKSSLILGMIGDFCGQVDTAILWIKGILDEIKE